MLEKNKLEGPLFASVVNSFVEFIETEFGSNFGKNLPDNIEKLSKLLALNKFQIESWLSLFDLISLNDEEFDFIQENIERLIEDNKRDCRQLGIPID